MSHLKLITAFLVVIVLPELSGCSSMKPLQTSVRDNPGDAKQQFSQGLDVTQGQGAGQDYRQGVGLFRSAALNGSVEGAYLAGMSYVTGRGVETDYAEAAKWLDLAAQKDHPGALYQLAVLYMNGRGVEKSRLWAGFLYSRAADLGHQQAMFDLGVVYARGLGLPQNPAAAWYWFYQSEKKGVPLSTELKKKMYALSDVSSRKYATRVMSYSSGKVDRSATLLLQLKLADMGYEPGVPDGIWGLKTEYAYRRFTRNELLLSDLEINWQNLKLICDF